MSRREWILPTWLEYLHAATDRAEVGLDLVAVVAEDDEKCIELLENAGAELVITEAEGRADLRSWNSTRYQHMVSLRNTLLKAVRSRAPFYFLSLDSDILLHPDSIAQMFEVLEDRPDTWAVGSKCFLSNASRTHPNMAMWGTGRSTRRFTRHDSDRVLPVDVLMAIKLMTPKAYSVDYSTHRFGEDFGWSKNCMDEGAQFYWDGRVTNKHVMRKENLDTVDVRVGF